MALARALVGAAAGYGLELSVEEVLAALGVLEAILLGVLVRPPRRA